jgi:hypothetical protein
MQKKTNNVNIKDTLRPPTETLNLIPTEEVPTSIPANPTAFPNQTITEDSITPTPTQKPKNPPVMKISFPSEDLLSITFTRQQTFCVVDVPISGSATKRKHNINNTGWTQYAVLSTLCYDPAEGQNTLQLQYVSDDGTESEIYTRQFFFHRKQDVTISISGQLFSDDNCNDKRDSGEINIINNTTTVNFFRRPEYYLYASINTNNDGTFSLSKTVDESESTSIALDVVYVAPSGYKINASPTTATLDKTSPSVSLELPLVPNSNIGFCFQ